MKISTEEVCGLHYDNADSVMCLMNNPLTQIECNTCIRYAADLVKCFKALVYILVVPGCLFQ